MLRQSPSAKQMRALKRAFEAVHVRSEIEAANGTYLQVERSEERRKTRESNIALPLMSFGGCVVGLEIVDSSCFLVISTPPAEFARFALDSLTPRRLDLKARLP